MIQFNNKIHKHVVTLVLFFLTRLHQYINLDIGSCVTAQHKNKISVEKSLTYRIDTKHLHMPTK